MNSSDNFKLKRKDVQQSLTNLKKMTSTPSIKDYQSSGPRNFETQIEPNFA